MTQTKTVLITGASRGIGLLAAQEIAKNGHTVYASMRGLQGANSAAADELRQWGREHDAKLLPIELDVTDGSSVTRAVAEIEEHQPLDVLINNAGIMPTGVTEAYTAEEVQRYFDVNMFGIVRTSRAVLPAMRARKSGLLIHLSSAAGRFAVPFFGVYCASKWAMEAYCETLHYELESFGIESILVEPSGHGTDLVKNAPPPEETDRVEAYGDLANGRERMLKMFQDTFDANDPLTDAGNVARRIAALIDAPAPRPIRTQVGHDMGVEALNEVAAPVQANLISQLKPVYTGN